MITILNQPSAIGYLQKDMGISLSSDLAKQHDNDLLYIQYQVEKDGQLVFTGKQFYQEGSTANIFLYNMLFAESRGLDLLPNHSSDKSIQLNSFTVTLIELRETFVEGASFEYEFQTEAFDTEQLPAFTIIPSVNNAVPDINILEEFLTIIPLTPKTNFNYLEEGEFFISFISKTDAVAIPFTLKTTYFYNNNTSEIEEEILMIESNFYHLEYINMRSRFGEKIISAEIDGKQINRVEIVVGSFDKVTCYFESATRYESYALGFVEKDCSLQVLNTKGDAQIIFEAKENQYSTLENQLDSDLQSSTQSMKMNTGILSKEDFFFFDQVLQSQQLFIKWNNVWQKITRAKSNYKYFPNQSINSIDLELTIAQTNY